MVQVGILLALACALVANVGLLCKYRGAVASPTVELTHPLRSAVSLFHSRWWTIGFAVAFVAWTLHVAALTMAPLSLVETTISGGLLLLAWLAERWFGVRVGPREWIGLALCAVGLALLAVTSASTAGASSSYSVEAMVAFEVGAVGIGTVLLLSGSATSPRRASGPLLGIAAGAFLALAKGLQTGGAIPVITLSSVCANLASVGGGILVFGDPMGSDPLAIAGRCVAFAAVIAAVIVLPAPGRAVPARA
jgi:hypothetical protein